MIMDGLAAVRRNLWKSGKEQWIPAGLWIRSFFKNLPEEKICIYLEFFNIKDFQADVRILAVRVAEEEKEGEKPSLLDPENVLYSQEISIISMYLPNENTS